MAQADLATEGGVGLKRLLRDLACLIVLGDIWDADRGGPVTRRIRITWKKIGIPGRLMNGTRLPAYSNARYAGRMRRQAIGVE
jgi:hypothetical protein